MTRVEELPQELLERVLTQKKKRCWKPASPSESSELTPGPYPASISVPIEYHGDEHLMDVKGGLSNGSPSLISVPIMNTTPQSRSPRSSLREIEFLIMLHAGSDEESSDSDDEEVVMAPVPRVARLLMETPEDADEPAPVPLNLHDGLTDFLPRSMYDFEWRLFPDPPIHPELRRETFSTSNCGPTVPSVDPYDIFIAMWDHPFMEYIASETNTYAQQYAERMMIDSSLQPGSRICEWKDTCVGELYTYFAIILAMGVTIKSRVEEYWNCIGDIFSTPGFRSHMSLRRFQLLNKCLHFANSCDLVGRNLDPSDAKLFKIQPVLDHLNRKFSDLYKLKQNIVLDESLLQWNGWLSINQFIPNKAAHVGIKSYEICESQTGYLWRFEIHVHQRGVAPPATEDPISSHSPALVLRLLQGLEHKGHTIWMDNFHNSPALARKLKTLGFDCVGTLRTNRQYVPVELTNLTKSTMYPGELAGYTSGDVDVMVWRDQNRVATISTYHGNASSIEPDGTSKPILIRDYNVCMGGIDKKDQMLATYPIERKRTRVWYKKLFRRLLNVSVLNSYIIHKQTQTYRPLTHRQFRINLIRSLLDRHSSLSHPQPSTSDFFEVKTHYPAENPFAPSQNGRQRRVCVVCHKRTTTHCVGCGKKPVCAFTCFRLIHL